MKRFFTILGAALLLGNGAAFAEESTLIDFSQLIGDATTGLHAPTTIDYSRQAGSSYSAADKANMKISLAIPSWEVKLASSARTIENMSESYVAAAPVSSTASKYAGETVLGVRIHFPAYAINSYADIVPPFDIPAYATLEGGQNQAKPGAQFDGYGVLKNVGTIKAIQVDVLGRNYPEGLSLVLANQDGVQQDIFIDYLNFDGWKSLVWNNPDYQTQVRNRELKVTPLYPHSQPYVKLKAIRIHRDSSEEGGDVVLYIKDIKVIYDLAQLNANTDINDEAVWGILQQREQARRNFELSKLGNDLVLRALEQKKMAQETSFNQPSPSSGSSATTTSTTTAPAATGTATTPKK
jgi:hypothetical protein